MTDPTLATAEEWLREASVNPTPAALRAEYDRRGALIAELESDRHPNWRRMARQQKDSYDELEAALAATEPVVEAARAVAEGYRRPELWDELWGRVEALAARVAELPTEERKAG